MNLIEWSDEKFKLGINEMDVTHHEFIYLVNKLVQASNTEFPLLFESLMDHTLLHFSNEEKLMRESSFPSIAEHKEEHQRILGELTQLGQRVKEGQLLMAKSYIKDRIPEWFAHHASTMDSALAAHLKHRQG